jgi:hypothetical protein
MHGEIKIKFKFEVTNNYLVASSIVSRRIIIPQLCFISQIINYNFSFNIRHSFRRFCKDSKSDYYLRQDCTPICRFVCPHGTTLFPLHGFSWNVILGILLKSVDNINKIRGGYMTLHDDLRTFMIIWLLTLPCLTPIAIVNSNRQ